MSKKINTVANINAISAEFIKSYGSRPIKTTLPDSINSIEEAKKYLTDLYNNKEDYHCDDDAGDCLRGISEQDANHMNYLMNEVHKYLADPCMFLLELSGHNMED